MEQFSLKTIKSNLYNLKDDIHQFLANFLNNTDEKHPYECDIPVGDWCAVGLSSLELPNIVAMYLDKKYNHIWMKWEGEDEFYAEFWDLPIEDLIEIVEGLEEELNGKSLFGNHE